MELALPPRCAFAARAPSATAHARFPHSRASAAPGQRGAARRYHRGGVIAASPQDQDDAQVAELLQAADALMTQLGSPEAQSAAAAEPAEGPASAEPQGGRPRQRIMKLVCDESSCVIVPAAADDSSYGPPGSFLGTSGQAATRGSAPRDFLLSEGEGWKLGFDRDPVSSAAYTALVASDAWSVSLTKREFTDFVQLLRKLQRSIETLRACGEWGSELGGGGGGNGKGGPPPVESTLELQTERVWVQARAPQKQLFDLTKVFQRGVRRRGREQQAAFHLRFIVTPPPGQPQREFEGRFSAKVVMRLLEHLETYPPALEALEEQGSAEGSVRDSVVAEYI